MQMHKFSTTSGPERTGRAGLGRIFLPAVLALLMLNLPSLAAAQSTPPIQSTDWSSVQNALGVKGQVQPSGVFKIEFSRQDQSFTENNVPVPGNFFADGYLAFNLVNVATPASNGAKTALVIGEIPLLETEVDNFEKSLQQGNLNISAVHNHEILETPRLVFVHIESVGDPTQMATAIKAALQTTGGNFKESSYAVTDPGSVDFKTLQSAIGHNAQVTADGGVVDVTVNRTEQFTTCDVVLSQATSTGSGTGTTGTTATPGPALIASNNCLLLSAQTQPGISGSTSTNPVNRAFLGSLLPAEMAPFSEFHFTIGSNGLIVDAEFALLATEVNPTVQLLRNNNFTVSALHNHLLNESPRLFFVHASGSGSAAQLATIIRIVLDQNAIASGSPATATKK